ncbi:MAG TPA: universal stress protein [Janthinobacterium sp.]|nr:universal stress protein [Janthinobacterium sp.]
MTIREILLPVVGTSTGAIALAMALSIAKRWNAHVTALYVPGASRTATSMWSAELAGAMVDDMIAAMQKESNDQELTIRSEFERIAARQHVVLREGEYGLGHATASFAMATGREEVFARQARLADLTVVPHLGSAEDNLLSDALHAVLFDSGRPAMIAPRHEVELIGTRVCLAWNGTAESAASVISAMPWMTRADAVCILSAEGYQRRGPAAPELAAYLALHGVRAEIRMFPAIDNSVGAGLLEAARQFSCDLLSMGAYSHSRLRQAILGGVTRHVLENATIPVMMTR